MIEALIINKILESKSLKILKDNGVQAQHFLTDKPKIDFILNHFQQYGVVPDKVTFLAEFDDFDLVSVSESDEYLTYKLKEANIYKDIVPLIKQGSDLVRDDSIKALQFFKEKIDEMLKNSSVKVGRGHDIVAEADERQAEFEKRCEQGGLLGISTGITMLDEILHGWVGEDLTTIFARTNMGKSWILLFFLVQAWKQGKKVLLYSGEMSRDIMGFRFDTFFKNFSNKGLMNGNAEAVDRAEYKRYIDDLKTKSGFIIVTPKDFGGRKPNVDELRNLMVYYGADILGVDQITLMTDKRKGENKRIQYTNISEDLFLVSEELQKPILAVTQANRDSVKNKKDKESAPELHEIGESDGIAQNSTRVISLIVVDGVLKLVIKKNRYGLNNKEVLLMWDIDKGIIKPMLEGGQEEAESYGF